MPWDTTRRPARNECCPRQLPTTLNPLDEASAATHPSWPDLIIVIPGAIWVCPTCRTKWRLVARGETIPAAAGITTAPSAIRGADGSVYELVGRTRMSS